MRHLRHLVVHDVRLHWPLISAWVAIVLAHPLVAAVPWSEDSLALGLVLATGLVGARLVIGAVVIATLVQADSPIDDGSFWRTRPIAPSTMAAAKLALTVLVFVLVPLLVVLAVAVTMQVPARHWPATIGGVLLGEVPAVMLALVVAARTRRPSAALVGLAGGLAILLLVVALTGQILVDLQPSAHRVDPFSAPVWLALWMTAWLPLLAWAVWWGTKVRGVLAVGATVALLGVLAIWLVPVVRSAMATTEASSGVTLTRLDARRVAGSRVRVTAVVSHPFRADATLLMETMTVVVGSRMARLPGAVAVPMQLATPSERVFTVADLSEADAVALQGQTVRVTGRLFAFTSRRTAEAHTALVAGSRFDGRRIRGRINRVYRPTEDVPNAADIVVLSLGDAMGLNRAHPQIAAFLRDGRTHARHALTHVTRKTDAVSSRVQLPVIAQPFAVHRVSLRANRNDLSAIERSVLALEIDVVDADATFVRVDGSLPMPALTREARP
jgi:hypothetical protein